MPKTLLFVTAQAVVTITALTTLYLFNDEQKTPKSEIDTAVNQAKFLYGQRKEAGDNFSAGPCISNALMPNWVADIAHYPRISTDDLPQNQCPAYLEERAQHFVELDPDGNLIRAR